MKIPALFSLIFLSIFLQHLHAQVIPDNRRIHWNPGIPGGIPLIEGPVENVLQYGADPSGQKDSHDAIAEAVSQLPQSGGIVHIPGGTYLLSKTLLINKDRVILRGDGMTSTRLLSDASGVSIQIESRETGEWQKMISGYSLGSSRIEVENGLAFSKGSFLEIQQENDSSIMYTEKTWIQGWSENSVGQVFEIADIRGNVIILKTALHLSLSRHLNPVARPFEALRNVGIEDLYIQKLKPADHTISITHTAYCWIKKVESEMTMRSHVQLSASLGHEIEGCYFHKSYHYGGGGHGYGVMCGNHTSDVLVENNAFDSLRHAMMVQTGANGNVFAYNYSNNPVQADPGSVLNTGWIPPDISVHGHYPFMNLFEGNDVMEIGISDYWGPAGPGNTYLRNRVRGDGILCYDHSHEQNLLGNVTTTLINTDNSCLRLLEHGNTIGGVTVWDEQLPGHTIPESFYLKEAPDYFEGYSWPPFGPGTGKGNILPAKRSYEKFKSP